MTNLYLMNLMTLAALWTSTNALCAESTKKLEPEAKLLAAEIAPYVFLNDGVPSGAMANVVQEMARRVNHTGAIDFLPWARAQQLVRDQKDSLVRFILPLTRTPEREELYTWVAEIMTDDLIFVTDKAKRPVIMNPDVAKDIRVGVLLGSPGEAALHQRGFTKVDASVNEETNAKKLNSGRIDAWLVARTVAPFSWKREGLPAKDLEYGFTLRTNRLFLGASKSTPADVVAKWQKALQDMKADGTYMKLMNDKLLSNR